MSHALAFTTRGAIGAIAAVAAGGAATAAGVMAANTDPEQGRMIVKVSSALIASFTLPATLGTLMFIENTPVARAGGLVVAALLAGSLGALGGAALIDE